MLKLLLIQLLALPQQAPPKPAQPAAPSPAPRPQVIAPERSVATTKKKADERSPGEVTPAPAPDLTKEQTEARALGGQALALFKTNEFAKAIDLAQRSLTLDPKYELAARVLGWCAVATGDDRKAEEILTRALNMNPADGELQFLLAGCHKRLQEWGAAKDLLADLVKREGPTVRVLLEMGECCLGEEDYDGALAVLATARELAPKDPAVVEHIIDVHEAREDWDKAVAELRTRIAASPKEAPLRYRLAQDLLNGNKLEEAARELEETTKVLVEDPQPHKLLETLYSGPLPNEQRCEFHRNWLKEWNLRRR